MATAQCAKPAQIEPWIGPERERFQRMQRRVTEAAFVIGLAALVSNVAAEDRFKTSCTATAGLAKHVPATTTTGTERTGSYDVTLSGTGRTAELMVEAKKPVSAGDATKVASTIDKVLLRSPYKSEATALPASESQGSSSNSHIATFDLGAIQALPAGDIDIVVMTTDGERVCRIKSKDRQKLVASR
jgi:hypothetical protein